MEWALYLAFYWWFIVAAFIINVIFRNSHKKTKTKSGVVNLSSRFGENMIVKKF
jgi:predicted permease